jgi:hypothetical protein
LTAKLIMTWDITPDREQEYFEFVVRDFIPGVQRLGFELSDAWATVYGEHPRMLVGVLMPTIREVQHILQSSDWRSLNNQLQDYVENYAEKIVPARGGFQF